MTRTVQITYYDVNEVASNMITGFWRGYLSGDYDSGEYALALTELGLAP